MLATVWPHACAHPCKAPLFDKACAVAMDPKLCVQSSLCIVWIMKSVELVPKAHCGHIVICMHVV